MDKIKRGIINKYLIIGCLNEIQEKRFKKLSKKNVSMTKEGHLKLLTMTIRDIISVEEHNKRIIEKIYNSNNPKYSLIKEVLKLTLDQWYKYFTYHEEIDLLNDFNIKQKELNKSIIKRADDLLNIIGKNVKGDYFTKFTYYLYNYKKWFEDKKPRGKENKKKKKSSISVLPKRKTKKK